MEKNLPSPKIQEHVKKVTEKIVPHLTKWLDTGEVGKISFEINTSQGGVSECKYKIEGKM